MNDREFGEFVLRAQNELGLSGRALAKKMGVSRSYLSDVQLGHRQASERFVRTFCEATELDLVAVSSLVGRIPKGYRPTTYETALSVAWDIRSRTRGGRAKG